MVLQRLKEAFSGVCLKHQSLNDLHHLLEMAETIQRRYTLPKKESVPSFRQLHGAPCPGGAVEERTAALFPLNVTSFIQPLDQGIINAVKCLQSSSHRQAAAQLGAEVGDQDQRVYMRPRQ